MRAVLFIEDDGDRVKFNSFNMAMGGRSAIADRNSATKREADCNHAPDRSALDLIMQFIQGISLSENSDVIEHATTIPSVEQSGEDLESWRRMGFKVEDSDKIISIGPLTINISRHQVSVGGQDISLTATEFRVLVCLAERPGRVQSRDNIMNTIWNYALESDHYFSDTRTIDVHIKRLRVKLGAARNLIHTVRGFGYKIECLEN